MTSQICLKWNSFLNNIATSFESLWEEEGLVDVTLASDGQCLTAHKVILSASSPFFKKVFQTNPCQHPVIILQDVHFSELEALLIFIYKGEVNIEQKNLPALLKAAETLQIRGLSGGDIISKESFRHLAELEQSVDEDAAPAKDEAPKKKQKTSRLQNNSILEKALTLQTSRSETFADSNASDKSKDSDCAITETLSEEVYQQLEMKIEPFELAVENLPKSTSSSKESVDRLSGEQSECSQGSSRSIVTVIAEARRPQSPFPEPLSFSKLSACDSSHLHFSNEDHSSKISPSYPPFPCPFCDRAYTTWGFRRRHIKAVHTLLPELNCKWCSQVLPNHAAWGQHVISAHNLLDSDAQNGLLILEEAHMVLQIAHPTRLESAEFSTRRCAVGTMRSVTE